MWFCEEVGGGNPACQEVGAGSGRPVFIGLRAGHQAFQNSPDIRPFYLGPMSGPTPLIVWALYGDYSGHGVVLGKAVIG